MVAESGSEEREESEERGAVVFFFGSGEADYWSSGASSSSSVCVCVCVSPGKGERRRRRSVRHGGEEKRRPQSEFVTLGDGEMHRRGQFGFSSSFLTS